MSDVLATLKKLPEACFAITPLGKLVRINRGESGCYPVESTYAAMVLNGIVSLDKVNEGMGCDKAQREAMLCGSMFGWETPAADPDNYDESGKFKRKEK